MKRILLVMACAFCCVVSTLHAQSSPIPDDIQHHEVVAGTGEASISDAESSSSVVSSATELDAIRSEIVKTRRFIVLMGGMALGWVAMRLLYKFH